MLLSLIPACATFPTQRLLFYAGLGGAALLALLLAAAWQDRAMPRLWLWTARLLSVPLIAIHFVAAPMLLASTGRSIVSFGGLFTRAAATLPTDDAVRGQQAVVVNAPAVFLTGFAPVYQALQHRVTPQSITTLATGLYPIEVERRDAETLVVRPRGGFAMAPGTAPPGQTPKPINPLYFLQIFDVMYCDDTPFTLGRRPSKNGIEVEITALTDAGRPAEAAFRFAGGLDAPTWRWLRWQRGGLAAWTPPAVGERVELPAVDW